MKISYIANIRMPTEKAHGVQIMKMCEALANTGVEVKLLIPKRHTYIKNDPFEYYGTKNNFTIKRFWCLDLVKYGFSGFMVETVTFALSLFFYTRKNKADAYYSRDELPLIFAPAPRYWEAHIARYNFLVRTVLKCTSGVIVISNALKNYFLKQGVSGEILVAHDGVDISAFNMRIPIHTKKIVLYVGHLYKHKGVDTLALAAKYLDKDVTVRFVGGTEEEIETFRARYKDVKNIEIIGHRAHNQVPKEISEADVLVLPNSGRDARASIYTSPMKLFEYMASGVPIVASNVPAILEVLSDKTAILVSPDDPQALAEGIKKVLNDKQMATNLAKTAKAEVRKYTWDKRAELVLGFSSLRLFPIVAISKLSIIVPVYNEERTIAELIGRLAKLVLPSGVEKEIIVVDDGSSDRTSAILNNLATGSLSTMRHEVNLGKGMAIRTGLAKATGDYVVIQDADLEYDPTDISRMVTKANETGAEVVFGSRRLPSPNQEQGKWYYYLGGVYLTWLANILYGIRITDEPTCYKMVKTDLLRSLNLTCIGFEFCPEVVAKLGKRKIQIIEVPISYHPRSAREGKKIKLRDAFTATWVLIKNRF